jgi:hypothetical protein
MEIYFKKLNGDIIQVTSDHDIDSLKSRFKECDANGKEIKPKAKAKKKTED